MSYLRLALLFLLVVTSAPASAQAGDWPQWRGPDRSNISREKGLLTSWPKEGPPLAWKAEGLGTGPMSLSVAGGSVFALGYKDGRELLHALDEASGRILWSKLIGPGNKGNPGMDWLSQRSPTVDGQRVYAFGVKGDLVCLETDTGKELWRKHYVTDFEGKAGPWGFCDYPLVDGDKLICTPGGDKAAILALDKRTGAIVWRCAVPKSQRATYGAMVIADRPGNRMYIQQMDTGTLAVAASDGKLRWHHPKGADSRGNVHTAIVRDDLVFHSNGWNIGCGLLKLLPRQNDGGIEEIYYSRVYIDSWLGSSVLLGDQVHTSCGRCIDFLTGKVLHDLKFARTTMTSADGRLYHRTGNNLLILHEYTPNGYVEKARFQVPRLHKTGAPTWSFPVIAGGKLYLRDQDVLSCYDIRAPQREEGRAPRPIFVPTPQDIVEKMLELAKVTKDDVVYDLGCGDGRIVVTAARKYGCKAVGLDLDRECVRLAQENVKKHGVEHLVRIERQDIFQADWSQATVVTLYLLPSVNVRLLPKLEKLKAGSRIVSHAFDMKGAKPDKVIRALSQEEEVERPIYLWTLPLKKERRED